MQPSLIWQRLSQGTAKKVARQIAAASLLEMLLASVPMHEFVARSAAHNPDLPLQHPPPPPPAPLRPGPVRTHDTSSPLRPSELRAAAPCTGTLNVYSPTPCPAPCLKSAKRTAADTGCPSAHRTACMPCACSARY